MLQWIWGCMYFILFYFYFIFKIFYFIGLPYIDMNPPQVYISSQPWTSLPSPSPYHLSGSSQYTSPKHPVSCIEPRLVIRFLHDSIHISMPFSQIIPPWRRVLRVPWTARKSNQSLLKEISPDCSLDGLMLMLKLQYFGHLMQRTDSLEKTLMLGKIEGRRRGDD